MEVERQLPVNGMTAPGFLELLAETPFSRYLRESLWAYPIVETVHVLTLCLFLGFTLLLDLRLLGLALRRVPASEAVRRLEPGMALGFAVMLATGGLLFAGDPVKFYGSVFLRIKLGMIVLGGVNLGLFRATVFRGVSQWDRAGTPPARARAAAIISIALWCGVAAMGRAIAYLLPA
jgi:hypothetical protein